MLYSNSVFSIITWREQFFFYLRAPPCEYIRASPICRNIQTTKTMGQQKWIEETACMRDQNSSLIEEHEHLHNPAICSGNREACIYLFYNLNLLVLLMQLKLRGSMSHLRWKEQDYGNDKSNICMLMFDTDI